MNRLKELRIKAFLSQLELAKLSGVSPWTISRIEHSKRLPQVGAAYQLARSLGMSIEELFFPIDICDTPVHSDRYGQDGR